MGSSIKSSLLRDLLPGLLPLIVFIIADEIWGTVIGLYIAIGFGIIEFLFTYLRSGKIEKFILFDVGLLIVLGLISLLLESDIFFKLKPVVIEGILLVIIGFSAYGRKNYILAMSGRFIKDKKLDDSAMIRLNETLKILFWLIFVHVFLVLFSVFFMSTKAWGFISGVVFYVLILGFFAVQFLMTYIQRKKLLKSDEFVPLVDENGAIIGRALRSELHFNPDKKLLHPVVHLHVFNDKGELYLQKRQDFKLIQPGKWDTAVGGHIAWGESLEESLMRESYEEISIKDFTPNLLGKYIWETEAEKELVFMFITKINTKPLVNTEEVSEGRFWKAEDIENRLGKDIFTPNLEHEIQILKKAGYIRMNNS